MPPEQLFADADRADSPVIGVYVMFVITLILAAAIFFLVLGFGGSTGEPAPSPTIDSNQSAQELNFTVTGGDSFSTHASGVDAEVNVKDTNDSNNIGTAEFDEIPIDMGDRDVNDTLEIGIGEIDDVTVEYYSDIPGDVVNVDEGFSFEINDETGDGEDYEIIDWEVEIVWKPDAGFPWQVIYSDSS